MADGTRQSKRTNGVGGILIGIVAALVIFGFSGTSAGNTNKWTKSVGTIIGAYTITAAEDAENAGIYADVEFVDDSGAVRTERSGALKSELTSYVGKRMEIKYDPNGTGVVILGFEASQGISILQIAFTAAAILVIFGVGELIKKVLPTPEEYQKRHPRK